MTLEEAIRYLELIYDDRKVAGVIDELPGQQAIKLGIETLKFKMAIRAHTVDDFDALLPGETKD